MKPPSDSDQAQVPPSVPALAILLLDGRGGAELLGREGAGGSFRVSPPGDRWILVNLEDEEARRWLVSEEGVGAGVAEALLAPSQRSWVSTDVRCGRTMALLQGFTDVGAPVELRLVVDPGRLITVISGGLLPAIEGSLAHLRDGTGARDVAEMLDDLRRIGLARLAAETFTLDTATSDLEYVAGGTEASPPIERLRALWQRAALLRRRLAHHRQALEEIERSPGRAAAQRPSQGRSSVQELDDLVEVADRIVDRLNAVDGYLQNRMSSLMNDRLYALTLISGLVLPLSFVTGLLGVNVGGIPLRDAPWAFAFLCAFLLLLSLLVYVLLKRLKWLPRQTRSFDGGKAGRPGPGTSPAKPPSSLGHGPEERQVTGAD